MNRKAAKKTAFTGRPWNGTQRHPLARQDAPTVRGWYWVKSYPGDTERRLEWQDGAFHSGAQKQVWFSWREV